MKGVGVLLLAAWLLAACSPSPKPTTTPVAASSGVASSARDPNPDWPTKVVLAVPPLTPFDQYAAALDRWNELLARGARLNGTHPFEVVAYQPDDAADLAQALVAGRVDIAVLDAYWVAVVQRQTDLAVQQQALVDDRQSTVAGWVTVGDVFCADAVVTSGGIGLCNGAGVAVPSAGASELTALASARIVLGAKQSATDFLMPAAQLLDAGIDPPAASPALDDAARLEAICRGEADVTVVRLPLDPLPATCANQPLVVFATTAAVPNPAIVTTHLPDLMAEQLALELGGQANCEIAFEPSPCPPLWVPLWGRMEMGSATLDYASVREALNAVAALQM